MGTLLIIIMVAPVVFLSWLGAVLVAYVAFEETKLWIKELKNAESDTVSRG